MALMATVSIILTRFFSFMLLNNTIRISFGDVPIILAGIFLGPVAGAVTGVVSDLLGILIRAQGGFFPGFTLSAALTGFIPGLFFMNYKLESNLLVRIISAVLITDIIVSLGLNTLWLSIMFGKAFLVLLPARLIARAIITPTEMFFIFTLIKYARVTPVFELKQEHNNG
jgi:ECF transporter S component (folate family)